MISEKKYFKNKLLYISPSVFPSQAANSTHVILQAHALSKYFDHVHVIGISSKDNFSKNQIIQILQNTYDLDFKKMYFSFFKNFFGIAENFMIAIFSIPLMISSRDHHIITRNIYAAFFALIFFKRNFIYETHTVEKGFKKAIQNLILKSKKVSTIVISKKLKELLIENYKTINNIHILHDAARSDLESYVDQELFEYEKFKKYSAIVGYFGSLLPGRGIEIIDQIAEKMPDLLFFVCGPDNQNMDFQKKANLQDSNIFFGGFIDHKIIHKTMSSCDVLLMPYQKKVFIDNKGSDTSKWMSPMKMFEYMATGRPIISSDLPVLREVLVNGFNALLVSPANINEWVRAIESIQINKELGMKLAKNARKDYLDRFNWNSRAKIIKEIFNGMP